MQGYYKPLTAVLIAFLFAAPTQSRAQDDDERVTLERTEVTGSRIRGAELAESVPIQTITRAMIERSGLTSVADVLQQLTAGGSALNTKFNSSGNFGFPPDGSGVGAGSATVDLRHLSSKRVLVLVDGIRWVNESSASGVSASVDLNTIPLSIIDRIEVLEDGASAIYGSDAIAGVVNIITRRNFDGAEVGLYYGANEEGDGETTRGHFSFGRTSEAIDFFGSASYVDQQEIASRDREISQFPVPGTGLTFASSATPQGRFIFFNPDPNFGGGACSPVDSDGDGIADQAFCNITTPNNTFYPNGPQFPSDFIGFRTANRFNFAAFNLLLTPSERKSLYGQTRFRFSDSVSGYVRALWNQRESVNQAAPEPFFLGPDAGVGNPLADNIVISADNPFNPFGVTLDSSNLVFVARRPVEGGPRRFIQDVDTWYIAGGLEGAFDAGDRSFFWDVNVATSENEAEQTNFGSYNLRNINLALGPLANCLAVTGCVPLNIFGGAGSITPEMLGFIQTVVRDRSKNELFLFSANLSGELFELPAGPLEFAAGYEYRDLEGSYQPDALTVAGDYNGVPSSPTSGSYDVNETFVEVAVPIYEAGESRLDLSLAGRYSDYSTFGGESTGKFGVRWQLSDAFLLRGTYAEGFRAPSIGELFGSQSRFDGTISDPCLVGLDGSPPEAPAANCQALGIAPNLPELTQQYSILTGGNPNLGPELADSITAGFVFSPSFANNTSWSERMDFEVTWYRHEVEGAVQAFDAQTAVNLCAATLDPSVCGLINRSPAGYIANVSAQLENLGAIETDGFDADWLWRLPAGDFGQFSLNWQNTFVTDYTAVSAAGILQPQAEGIEVNNSAIPEWTSVLALAWDYAPISAAYTIRHISDFTEDCGDAASFAVCSDPTPTGGTNHLGSTTYHDIQVGWNFDFLQGTKIAVGVNNVFGKDPPICLSCSLNGYDASTYDVPGRFWYIQADLKF